MSDHIGTLPHNRIALSAVEAPGIVDRDETKLGKNCGLLTLQNGSNERASTRLLDE